MQRRSIAGLVVAVGVLLSGEAGHAAQFNYVASTGRDSNPCTVIAPCRTLQHAIDTAPTGGEVQVLDSGNFGNATIGKSLTVSSDGETVFGGLTVNNASATIILRGLDLRGADAADIGIYIQSAAAVHIEHCSVAGFSSHGIYADGANTKIFVAESVASDNALSGLVVPPGASVRLTADSSRFENNHADGISINGGEAAITRSIASGNGGNGLIAQQATVAVSSTTVADNEVGFLAVHDAVLTLERSLARENGYGLSVLGSAATLSDSVFVLNAVGIHSIDGTVHTRGNNVVVDNGTDVSGSLIPLPGT